MHKKNYKFNNIIYTKLVKKHFSLKNKKQWILNQQILQNNYALVDKIKTKLYNNRYSNSVVLFLEIEILNP